MSNLNIEIYLNKVAQDIVKFSDSIDWFDQNESQERSIILHKLSILVRQAGGRPDDISEVVALSGLKPTYTPCILLFRKPLYEALHQIAHLPDGDHQRSYILLMTFLKLADQRRRSTDCKDGCNHWWHQDLTKINKY